jgi:hypothetical protein
MEEQCSTVDSKVTGAWDGASARKTGYYGKAKGQSEDTQTTRLFAQKLTQYLPFCDSFCTNTGSGKWKYQKQESMDIPTAYR